MKSPLRERTFQLAVEVVRLCEVLKTERKEYVLSRQILRSGTNPGAMVREAQNAESEKDFIHKLKVAQKEVGETQYWLDILLETGYIDQVSYDCIFGLTSEIMKMIRSAVLTLKQKEERKK